MGCSKLLEEAKLRSGVLLLACLAIMSSGAQAGELYRWVDASGKVYYGDVLPAGAMQVEVKKFPKDTTSNEYLPYETLRAQQNFPVTLYVADGCGDACVRARGLLNKRGVPFNEKQLKTKQDFDALKQLSGIESFVPVLAVGKNFLRGFLESQWNSELDFAGYPKSASYRQRVAAPSTPASAVSEAPSAEGQTTEGQSAEGQSAEGQSSPAEPAEQ
jgi:glutaredoxin